MKKRLMSQEFEKLNKALCVGWNGTFLGGGNSLKPSHNHGLWQVGMFNNLAPWGEKKFVSELKRTYKFQRGVYCHTEDNSPKYRMVGKMI